ncbi:MAG TPA: LysR family transcriptional regulator [Solirubrobacteraceae bacterium]|nr:LysR family transcriptional regulator [Solirubrobacteraceae bacterium]
MAVTVTQLVAFLAVARRGSVTAAARELVVTQPSVSAAIGALQRELGVTLMQRDGRSLRPTRAGEAYLPYATHVLGLLDQGARAARDAASGAAATLRLGAVTTAGEHLVAPLLRSFREAHPELEITLQVGNRGETLQRLLDREVDLAITGRVPPELPFTARPFAANPFLLITAASDPLAGAHDVALEELGTRPWLLREPGSGTRTLCEEYLARHGLNPRILTLGSNGAIRQAVGLGLGVALQSQCAVALELELGRLATVAVREALPRRAWHITHPQVGPVSGPAVAFVEFLGSRAAAQAIQPPG